MPGQQSGVAEKRLGGEGWNPEGSRVRTCRSGGANERKAGSDVTSSEPVIVSVDGHRIRLTNLDKVMYPSTGTTKADVLDYYNRVADVLIPHATDRPVPRKRWVHGVGTAEKPGQMFFQKNLEDSAPDWVRRRPIEHKDH